VTHATVSTALDDRDYARLLSVRTRLRIFASWSAERAAELGLTAAQHQLLLAIRGHHDRRGPTIGDVADYLLLRHHSAAELATRTQAIGLIDRVPDADDHRVVRLKLTNDGRRALRALSASHVEELRRLVPRLTSALAELGSPSPAADPGS
jgi:DNA-binding MarR family transcriptional regulator